MSGHSVVQVTGLHIDKNNMLVQNSMKKKLFFISVMFFTVDQPGWFVDVAGL